jgi:enoyl-CoA hydratase/carnithine racemase
MNAIGGDTIQMLQAGVKEAAANFAALWSGTNATDFSVGANLMLVLLAAQEGTWAEIDLMVRTFQNTMQSLRYADVPVIVAPAGLTLGGGCEMTLHADRVQAAAESYVGQVEVALPKRLLQYGRRRGAQDAAKRRPFVQPAREARFGSRVRGCGAPRLLADAAAAR